MKPLLIASALVQAVLIAILLWRISQVEQQSDRREYDLQRKSQRLQTVEAQLAHTVDHLALLSKQEQLANNHPFTLTPSFDPHLVPSDASQRCVGSGLLPAASVTGTMVLGPEADLWLQPADSIDQRPFSLRRWMETIPIPELDLFPASPPCYTWNKHTVAWRRGSLIPEDDICTTDSVGTSCIWRTDWTVPACRPTANPSDPTVCACPSAVAYVQTVKTVYTLELSRVEFFARVATLCSDQADDDDKSLHLIRFVPCTSSPASFCRSAVVWRSRASARDGSLPWPPASFPAHMAVPYGVQRQLHLRVVHEGCDGNRAYATNLNADDSMQVTCFWKRGVLWTVTGSREVTTDDTAWDRYGIAMSLLAMARAEGMIEDVCLNQAYELFRCTKMEIKLGTGADSGLLQWINTTATPEADYTLSSVTLVEDDLY